MASSHIDQQRRNFLLSGAALAAAPLLIPTQALAAEKDRYGIRGQLAPEITLDYWIDKEGKAGHFSVAENRGKWVFLKCFQNWCPGCHATGFPTLKAFADEFHDHPKVAIAGIQTVFEGFTANTQDDVRKLQLRYELPITMGHDPGNEDTHERPQTMAKYRTGGTPWLILIAPDGRVVFNSFHVKTDKLIAYVKEQLV
ncbi:MAG: peroxiredoxin family protein [Thiolinea sp.]